MPPNEASRTIGDETFLVTTELSDNTWTVRATASRLGVAAAQGSNGCSRPAVSAYPVAEHLRGMVLLPWRFMLEDRSQCGVSATSGARPVSWAHDCEATRIGRREVVRSNAVVCTESSTWYPTSCL